MTFRGQRAGKFRHQPCQIRKPQTEAKIKRFAGIARSGQLRAITGESQAFNSRRCCGAHLKPRACAKRWNAAGKSRQRRIQRDPRRRKLAIHLKARGCTFPRNFLRQIGRQHLAGAKGDTALQGSFLALRIKSAGKRNLAKRRMRLDVTEADHAGTVARCSKAEIKPAERSSERRRQQRRRRDMAGKPRETRAMRISADGAGKRCLGHAAKSRFSRERRTAGGAFQAKHHPRRFGRHAKRTGQHAPRWFGNIKLCK